MNLSQPHSNRNGSLKCNPNSKEKRVLTPKADTLAVIENYFGVTTDYKLGEGEQNKKSLVNGDEELTEYLEILTTRPEIRMLFQLSKDAPKEDVEAAVRIIEALRNK